MTFGAVKSYTHIFSQLERSDQSNQRLHSSTLLRLQLAREAATRAPRAMAQIPQFDTLLPFSSPLQYFVQLAVNFSLFFRFTFLPPAGLRQPSLPPPVGVALFGEKLAVEVSGRVATVWDAPAKETSKQRIKKKTRSFDCLQLRRKPKSHAQVSLVREYVTLDVRWQEESKARRWTLSLDNPSTSRFGPTRDSKSGSAQHKQSRQTGKGTLRARGAIVEGDGRKK